MPGWFWTSHDRIGPKGKKKKTAPRSRGAEREGLGKERKKKKKKNQTPKGPASVVVAATATPPPFHSPSMIIPASARPLRAQRTPKNLHGCCTALHCSLNDGKPPSEDPEAVAVAENVSAAQVAKQLSVASNDAVRVDAGASRALKGMDG